MTAPVVTLSPLEALLLRAGASDTDREAWLAQRAQGITGTEIRDLHLGVKRSADLIAEKLGRKQTSFAGNAFTRWGNEREPEIARVLEWQYGVAPETRLFRSADNPRFLVSPDGTGTTIDGELLGAEIKTCGEECSIGSPAFEKKGYLIQVVWAMVVTGARRWLYAWEFRHGTMRDGFEAGALSVEWVVWDAQIEILAHQLVAEAEAFLVELDAAAAAEYVAPDLDDEVDTHAVNYLRFISLESEAGASKKAEYDAILATVGEREAFQQEGATARVTLTPMKLGTRTVIDEAAAIEADPVLWERLVSAQDAWKNHVAQFSREEPTETKPRLTITAIKKGPKS